MEREVQQFGTMNNYAGRLARSSGRRGYAPPSVPERKITQAHPYALSQDRELLMVREIVTVPNVEVEEPDLYVHF